MSHTRPPAPAAWVGIDVSQPTPDACLLPAPAAKGPSRSFANDAAGRVAPAAWADEHAGTPPVGVCPESTGADGEALAAALADAGRHGAVVNPARVRYAGLMRGQGNKTDKADARLVAGYACRERPAPWLPPRPEVRRLQALSRRRDDRRGLAAREKGRLAAPGLTAAERKSIARVLSSLEKEADRLQGQADELIAAAGGPRGDGARLRPTPGVGPVAACAILAEPPQPGRFESAQQAAAYAGLAPREYRSGASVKRRTRLSQAGNARRRQALYLPAMTAVRLNPILKGFFERLVAAGKPKMAAIGACVRKLLMIAYGVLKSRRPFDPQWESTRAS